MVNHSLFGTSGIRGTYPNVVDEHLAFKVVSTLDNVVIARDTRRTSIPVFNAALSAALLYSNRVYIDKKEILPTPTLAFASITKQCNGVMITASHNPEEDCGIKIFKNGKEIDKDDEAKIEKDVLNFDYKNTIINKNVNKNAKSVAFREPSFSIYESDIRQEHVDYLLNTFSDVRDRIYRIKGAGKRVKVVVDPNGAAFRITPYVLKSLGCDVVTVNSSFYGFSRASEPLPSNLNLLSSLVISQNASFGIAHDGDADRVVIVDERGNIISQDTQLLLIVDYLLENDKNAKGNVISTVESSMTLKELVSSYNRKLILTPVGSTHISYTLEKENAVFGGEPCGEYVFMDNIVHAPDGIFATCVFLRIFLDAMESDAKVSDMFSKYKAYPIHRTKFRVKDKDTVMNAVKSIIESGIVGKENIDSNNISTVDGVRINGDGFWILIRPSGTENAIRLTVEAKDKNTLLSKIRLGKRIVEEAMD